jgi:AraC-like DNA-binding protein
VLELCREFAVSERTLHYAFQEIRGLSPMAYFKASRLNAVRQELKAAAAGTKSVGEIAQRWGFWHNGEFAADYRRLFGELPSQSLSRKPLSSGGGEGEGLPQHSDPLTPTPLPHKRGRGAYKTRSQTFNM